MYASFDLGIQTTDESILFYKYRIEQKCTRTMFVQSTGPQRQPLQLVTQR